MYYTFVTDSKYKVVVLSILFSVIHGGTLTHEWLLLAVGVLLGGEFGSLALRAELRLKLCRGVGLKVSSGLNWTRLFTLETSV